MANRSVLTSTAGPTRPRQRPSRTRKPVVHGLLCALLCMVLPACDHFREAEFIDTVEWIPLPPEIGSFKVAHQIATDVHHELYLLMRDNPDRFDARQVGYQVNWGKMEHMEREETIFYVKVVAKSVAPIEDDPAALALMQYAIDSVFDKIESTELAAASP